MVAEPEEKARAYLACSRAAIACSKLSLCEMSESGSVSSVIPTYLLGLELLTYSYAPMGFPTPVWAKVVEREIYAQISRASATVEVYEDNTDSITAPVVGS